MTDARILRTRSDLRDLCRWFEDHRRSVDDDFYARFFAMFEGSDPKGGFAIRPVPIEEMLRELESCSTAQGTTIWDGRKPTTERRNNLKTRLADMQARVESEKKECPWRSRVFFDLIDNYCVIVCGEKAVEYHKQQKSGRKAVSIKVRSDSDVSPDGMPVFKPGDMPVITVASEMAGFLYLFYQDALDNYCLVYPEDGEKSLVYISKNRPHDIRKDIEKAICDSFSLRIVETSGVVKSQERLIAIVVEPNVFVEEGNVRALMCKAPALSGEIATRGMRGEVGTVEFPDLEKGQYVYGYLTYWLDCR